MRTVKAPEIRRQELIEIALGEFMRHGYGKTSVRGILDRAGGKIGMFYHYFKSKDEIFEAALAYYNEQYVLRMEAIVQDTSIPLPERINTIFTHLASATSEYETISRGAVNPGIQTLLLASTLNALAPFCAILIREAAEAGFIGRLPTGDTETLGRFVLFGISGVIHDDSADMEQKIARVKELLTCIFDIQEG